MDRLVVLFNDGCLRGCTAAFLVWIIFSTVVKDAGFYPYDNFVLVWFFFVFHGVANIAFTFCLALLFDKGKLYLRNGQPDRKSTRFYTFITILCNPKSQSQQPLLEHVSRFWSDS